MDMTNVLHQMTLLFLLMLVGFLCRKAGAIEENADAVFASFVVNITLPASIIGASTSSNIYFDGTTVLLYASVSGMIYVLALGWGACLRKCSALPPKTPDCIALCWPFPIPDLSDILLWALCLARNRLCLFRYFIFLLTFLFIRSAFTSSQKE